MGTITNTIHHSVERPIIVLSGVFDGFIAHSRTKRKRCRIRQRFADILDASAYSSTGA